MSKSDIEMEGAEKLIKESVEKAQDPPTESIVVSEAESKTETVPAAEAGNNNKTDPGGDYLKKCSTVAQDEATKKSEVDAKTHPDSEAVPMDTDVERVAEQINEKSENVALIQSEAQGEEQTGGDSAVKKQTGANNELVANITNGGLKEVQSSADNMDKLPDEINKVNEKPVGLVAEEKSKMDVDGATNDHGGEAPPPSGISANKALESKTAQPDEIPQMEDKGMEGADANSNEDESTQDPKEQGKEMSVPNSVTAGSVSMAETSQFEMDESPHPNQQQPATPVPVVSYSPSKDGDHSAQAIKTVFTQSALPLMAEGDDGTPEDQATFMKELETFYRGRAMDFKPPKFYGQHLNCLKLWRSVIRLGGYDRVTTNKLWRQVGESFHPPKTCTTVSWTFRIFYEKSLLEFERHKKQCGELQLPVATLPEASGVENEIIAQGNGFQGPGSASGRARRDAAARAMQGWHAQRILDNGEVGEPIIKDKNANNSAKREKTLKSIGSIKQKRPNEVENSIKVARTESFKQLVTSVVDVGPPADWVKINIRQTKDCFEVYALVPGLLREEVRVQSDPAGRLVITGQPEQVENPWGITPFKKVVSLPARIDPLQTSAVVSLHGRLFVRVPFEQPNM